MPKVFLITGCSSGFGQEIALAALAHGDTVVATARDPNKLGDLASHGAITERLDVTDSDAALQKAVEGIVAKTGRIDILVNNVRHASVLKRVRHLLTCIPTPRQATS
jgi:NAD(P)-dependent dehydrogenase (short-subunit alcohol dehydrogenase family)